jgi:hypothetical protein
MLIKHDYACTLHKSKKEAIYNNEIIKKTKNKICTHRILVVHI